MVCKVLRRVVVETCVDCCAADRAAPTAGELLEYCENLFAMLTLPSHPSPVPSCKGPQPRTRYVEPEDVKRLKETAERVFDGRFGEVNMLPWSMVASDLQCPRVDGLHDDHQVRRAID